MRAFDYAFWIVFAVVVIDFTAFMGWALSGQMPTDAFFIGALTRGFFSLFL